MKTNTETYKVLINGDEFHLVSDETEEHVLNAAKKVDVIVQELSANGVDKRKASILAALQLASELLNAQNDLDQRKKEEHSLVSLIDHIIASL